MQNVTLFSTKQSMEVVQFFSNVFPILQVTLSSMKLDNHDSFSSLVLTALGAWVPEEQACSGHCLWEEVGCLVLALREGMAASWCHWLSKHCGQERGL